jgi:sugar lactone lactonase YvrE
MPQIVSPFRTLITHSGLRWFGLLLAVGCLASSAPKSFGQNNALVLDWPLGKDIRSGFYYYFTPGDGSFHSEKNYRNGVTISFNGSPHQWTLFFAAPGAALLTPGTYEGTVGFGQPGQENLPQMTISGDGSGFNGVGRFVVQEVVYGAQNTIISFHATFSQQASSSDPPAVGEILFNSTAPLPPDESRLHPPEEVLYEADGSGLTKFRPNGAAASGAYSVGEGAFALAFDRRGSWYVGGWRTEFDYTTGTARPFGSIWKGSKSIPGFEHSMVISLACDHSGNLYVGEAGTPGKVSKVTPDGQKSVFVPELRSPAALAFDKAGNLYVSDRGWHFVYKITPSGEKSTFPTGYADITAFAFDKDDNLLAVDAQWKTVVKISPDGVRTTLASGFKAPLSIAVDRDSNLFVGDNDPHSVEVSPGGFQPFQGRIYKRTPDGTLTQFVDSSAIPHVLAFAPHPPVVPQNIATRAQVGTGQGVLIAGFIVSGAGPKKVIVRGIGPSLSNFGVTGALSDPMLELHDSAGHIVATNDNWQDTQAQELGWSGLFPTNNQESALIATLTEGAYTIVLQGKNLGTGVGLVEVYDMDSSAIARLGNISTRSVIGTSENVLIAGFVLGAGEVESQVVVRALGPSLAAFDVDGALADPTLELHDKNGVLIASNDDWRQQQENELTQTGLAPTNDRESAILAYLSAGNYTAVARGKGETTGIGVIEVYHLE